METVFIIAFTIVKISMPPLLVMIAALWLGDM